MPRFAPFPEFVNASYARRYEILCEKLVREQLYTASALILSPRTAARSGSYREMGEGTGLQQFLARLAAFVAAEAARKG
ncbi:MAG: PaeR7I family type II restriction endonuclease [Alcanivoracaceae bacterium]